MADDPLRRLMGFSDDIILREQRTRSKSLGNKQSLQLPTSMVREYSFLPASQNIEDRRGEYSAVGNMIGRFTGMMPNQWSQAIRHPLTPDDFSPWNYPEVPPTTTDPLSSAAGYNDVHRKGGPLEQLMEALRNK